MRITSLVVRMRSSIALMLLLLGVSPASASVYHLSPSLAGSEVLGSIAGPVQVVLDLDRLEAERKELFNVRFQHATGALENTTRLGQVKREIARLITIQHERARARKA